MSEPERRIAEKALEHVMPQVVALDEAEVERCRVPGTRAVAVAQAMAERLPPDLARMEEEFKEPPLAEAESLVPQALALWAAEKRLSGLAVEPDVNMPALYREGGELKTLAVRVLELVDGDEPSVRKVLDDIRPGTGYVDRADDLTALYGVLRKRVPDLQRRELMTEDQVTRIGELGAILLRRYADPAELSQARELRDRTWTLFGRSYRTLRKHLTFLYADDGDGLDDYPNLYDNRRPRRTTTDTAETEPTPDEE